MKSPEEFSGVALNLKEDQETKKGRYSNMSVLLPEEGEILIDFLHIQPPKEGKRDGELVSRIILTPTHAKRLIVKMFNWLKRYEAKYGIIQTEFEEFDKIREICLPEKTSSDSHS